VKKATAIAALTTTADCDPFSLTACALTAAPNFSKLKMLSFTIVEDNNSVTAMHYGFIDVIQDHQVEALHTPTFRLSLFRSTI
jgi:hypothetical protein